MKTQSPTKTVAAKKATTSSKKSPGSQTPKSTVATRAHDEENVQTSSSSGSGSPDLQSEIAAMAYKIWQEQGCPEGHEDHHWHQAEQAVTRDARHTVSP